MIDKDKARAPGRATGLNERLGASIVEGWHACRQCGFRFRPEYHIVCCGCLHLAAPAVMPVMTAMIEVAL